MNKARHRSASRASAPEKRASQLRELASAHQWDRISPHDVAALLTDDWSGAGPIRLDETLGLTALEAAGAVMLANARAILRAAAAENPPVVPPAHLSGTRLGLEASARPPGFIDDVRAGFKDRFVGPTVHPPHWIQALLKVGALLKLSPAGLAPTDKGRELLVPARAGELYAHLFRTMFRRFNLAYLDRFPELPELQDLLPHWLWVLTGPLGVGFTSADMYVQVLIPRPLSEDLDQRAAPARLRQLIQTRVLDPLADFGLLEPKAGDDESKELGDVGFRPTELFRRFLRVDIPYPEVQGQRPYLRLLR